MNQRRLSLAILGLLAAMAAHAQAPARERGDQAPARVLGDQTTPSAATRVVRIDPATRSVNVRWGDTVSFVSNGKEFTYRFDGAPSETTFDLRRVAPAGVLDHEVIAYVDASYQRR